MAIARGNLPQGQKTPRQVLTQVAVLLLHEHPSAHLRTPVHPCSTHYLPILSAQDPSTLPMTLKALNDLLLSEESNERTLNLAILQTPPRRQALNCQCHAYKLVRPLILQSRIAHAPPMASHHSLIRIHRLVHDYPLKEDTVSPRTPALVRLLQLLCSLRKGSILLQVLKMHGPRRIKVNPNEGMQHARMTELALSRDGDPRHRIARVEK